MSKFDISQFKLALIAARERERENSRLHRTHHKPAFPLSNHRALAQILKPALEKAGVDLTNLNQQLAHNQTERRKQFQIQKADLAKPSAAQQSAFHHAIAEGQKALKYLGNLPADAGLGSGLSSVLTLTTPFLIWEWPADQALVDSHIEPLKSWARIRLDVPAYAFDNDSGSETREFSFYFYWTNSSQFVAIVKCFSVLGLNGACELYANSGIFSGDSTSLSIDAYLYPVTYWLPLSPGQDIRSLRLQGDPLQRQNVLNNLTATGGSIFGGADAQGHTFTAASAGMSYQSFGGLQIPAGATALFEVNLTLTAHWQGNTLPDEIIADFSEEKMGYSVECPLVALQFLTQPPVMA